MKERNKAVPCSYLILKRGKKILLGRRVNTSYYDGWYSVPAGHVEADELPLGGLIRESKEEIGITILPENAKLVHTMYRAPYDKTGQRVDFFFVVKKWSGEITNCEPDKCSDLRWFFIADLPKNMMHHVKHALECYQKGIDYSELPFHELFVNPNTKRPSQH
ncbi:MAG: NUDIX hydrolase [Parcubacteria group bacterium Gr01-1014_66]|nr:MAG: NUDIX hydrolase [Parcubacteria group bacterium Gr01-1014_66]